jgi:hypothetical protein
LKQIKFGAGVCTRHVDLHVGLYLHPLSLYFILNPNGTLSQTPHKKWVVGLEIFTAIYDGLLHRVGFFWLYTDVSEE